LGAKHFGPIQQGMSTPASSQRYNERWRASER
jgi:hypothetical protein